MWSMILRKPVVLGSLSIGLHMGMVALAQFTVGVPLLANTAFGLTFFFVLMIAAQLPSMVERGEVSRMQAWAMVGVSPMLLVVGIAAAALLERSGLTPTVRAASFLPWWFVYFTVILMQHAKATQSKAGWGKLFFIAAALSVFAAGFAFLSLSIVGYWP